MNTRNKPEISLQSIVGKGYAEFWNTRKTYVVCKGSRASKKSKTTALWHISTLMQYPLANALIVRKVERTLRDSCFSDLKWAIHRMDVDSLWNCTTSPLEMTYIPTGQKILFRGMDDPLKLASVSVPKGILNLLWVEEAYEIAKEEDFDLLDESIRGVLPEGYFKRVTLTFNPWNEHHWLKKRFFDSPDSRVYATTTNYKCNEWLSPTDLELFENMKERNPRRYRVAGLGDWGIVEGLVFENWEEKEYQISNPDGENYVNVGKYATVCGLDFGYTNDPTAFFVGFLDLENRIIYVWDEIYQKGLSNRKIYDAICAAGYGKERITGDSAEPKSIDELKGYGLRIKAAKKGPDSVRAGIQWLQDFKLVIHPRCVNFVTEISNYTWDTDKFGNKLNIPIDDFNHLMDAMRYGCEKYIRTKGWVM